MTFQEEYRRFLERHQVPYDERYVWDRGFVPALQAGNRLIHHPGRWPELNDHAPLALRKMAKPQSDIHITMK